MHRLVAVAVLAGLLGAAGAVGAADQLDGSASGPLPVDAFARLEVGMGEQQVIAIVGPPAAEGPYTPLLQRPLALIGLTRPKRTYFYRGLGRVLFDGGSQLLQNGTVARVEIDPREAGVAR
jgi:hypothetical protein